MNIPSNIGKSILLASSIFWVIYLIQEGDLDFAPIVVLSLIPISICVSLTIVITICPVFWALRKEKEDNKSLAKRCFPYYAIIASILCIYGINASYFDSFFVSFLISAYLTTAQSWVWFAKEKRS